MTWITNQDYHMQCQILLLMYFLELNDILFLIKSLKSPTPAFNIHKYVTFNISTTRSGSFNKLIHNFASTNARHSNNLSMELAASC